LLSPATALRQQRRHAAARRPPGTRLPSAAGSDLSPPAL